MKLGFKKKMPQHLGNMNWYYLLKPALKLADAIPRLKIYSIEKRELLLHHFGKGKNGIYLIIYLIIRGINEYIIDIKKIACYF